MPKQHPKRVNSTCELPTPQRETSTPEKEPSFRSYFDEVGAEAADVRSLMRVFEAAHKLSGRD